MNNQADTIDLNRDKTLTSSLNRTMYFFIKRLFDILMAIIGIIAMIPIALIVKVSYMLTGDFDSIFYKQKRIGKNGECLCANHSHFSILGKLHTELHITN